MRMILNFKEGLMSKSTSKKEYTTHGKQAVYDFFEKNCDRHYTVECVFEELKQIGCEIPKSTLYRIISNLSHSGILKRYESDSENCFVYQYANFGTSCDCHFHLKCSECGKLVHLECDKMTDIKEHIMEEHGFLIGGNGIINGICGECLKNGEYEK